MGTARNYLACESTMNKRPNGRMAAGHDDDDDDKDVPNFQHNSSGHATPCVALV
jgi:hypothetical protein